VISGSPSNSTRALSRPNRRLAPPARTNPRTFALAFTELGWHRIERPQIEIRRSSHYLRFVLDWLAPRPANTEFA
jgi:hypothetical protein